MTFLAIYFHFYLILLIYLQILLHILLFYFFLFNLMSHFFKILHLFQLIIQLQIIHDFTSLLFCQISNPKTHCSLFIIIKFHRLFFKFHLIFVMLLGYFELIAQFYLSLFDLSEKFILITNCLDFGNLYRLN